VSPRRLGTSLEFPVAEDQKLPPRVARADVDSHRGPLEQADVLELLRRAPVLLADRAVGGVEFQPEQGLGVRGAKQKIALHGSEPNSLEAMSATLAGAGSAHGPTPERGLLLCNLGAVTGSPNHG
jgi:hypothetical protein